MNPVITPEQLVRAVRSDFSDSDPAKRPVHAVGVGVTGVFAASMEARDYCVAEHFQGQRVPVSVRFSNGSGNRTPHDGWNDARGMATRFHLNGGSATDLIAMTLGSFFVPTTADFMLFCQAAQETPVVAVSAWRKLLDMLQFKQSSPDPEPGQTVSGGEGMLNYANRHRHAQLSVFQAGAIGAPVSYARATYHAVHTFVVQAPDGTRRPVRFNWQPAAGVAILGADEPHPDDYLQEELARRLADWPAKFILMMTIGESGDALDDPTVPWPAKRPRIVMGTLWVEKLAADQEADGEKISFNPCRLVPGIEVSNDPILQARRDAYEVSREWRGGRSCPFHTEAQK